MGLTPYKVAIRTGISQSTLSRIINKNSIPNESNMDILVKFFGVSEKWLLTGEDNNITIDRTEQLSIELCIQENQYLKKLIEEKDNQLVEKQKEVNWLRSMISPPNESKKAM